MQESVDKIKFPIDLTSTQEFKAHVSVVLSEIENLIDKRFLTFDGLHTLRKRIRLFADLMQVPASEDYGGKLHWLFYSIVEISSEVDKFLKELRQSDSKKEINLEDSITEVNTSIISQFKQMKPFIEKVCGVE